MTIAVGILGAVLGIVIGILVMRVKGAQRDAECKQSCAELETQVAVLQSQLNAETEKLHAARETAENQLAEVKAEAEKRIADEKDAAAKRLAAEKEEAEKRIAEERSRAEKRLADEKMAAEKRLETKGRNWNAFTRMPSMNRRNASMTSRSALWPRRKPLPKKCSSSVKRTLRNLAMRPWNSW